MDALTVSAASGMRARMESLEMLANNIANQSAAGYKADREFYSLYLAPEALDATGGVVAPLPPNLPVIERHWTDFSQGPLTPTGSRLNAAISGPGFFTVRGPSGALYTRNGDFRLSPAGVLQTQQGYPVLDEAGRTIQLDPAMEIDVASDGTIKQGGAVAAVLSVVDFSRPDALAKHAGTYFQLSDPDVKPARAAGAEIHQGKLETANFAAPEAAVRLIGVMRQFEMLQRALTLGGEMNRKSVEEVARVGS
ncbi:MAG: flagellar hook basal-body protein [Bryobacteraceae bacterium]|nr:flagellar hook basal-body protein [Bryobacteraceae bacterium]